MKNNILFIGFILCILLLCFLWYDGRTPQNIEKIDTVTVHDTLWKVDSCKIIKLIPKKIVEIKHDTVFDEKGDSIVLTTESKRYDETLTSGVDTCEVSAFVSGIHPSLDSLSMRLKTHHEVKTVEITNYVKKPKTFWDKFHIGLQMGYGLGLQSRKFDSYVGIGIGVDL